MTKLSKSEKLAAESIRNSNVFSYNPPDNYKKNMDEILLETRIIPTREGDCTVYVFKAKEISEPAPVHVYVHGGGFVKEHGERDELCSAKYAAMIHGIVVDIDYKLAPENKFPSAFNEVYDITKWINSNIDELGGDINRISMSGYSAGGNIVAAAAMLANKTKDFKLCKQIICYPPLDLLTDPAEKKGVSDQNMLPERARMLNKMYTGADPERMKSPYVSVSFAPDDMLEGLPSTLIITAGTDMLKTEAHEFAVRLIDNGVEVTVKCFREARHGFIINCTEQWEMAQQMVIDAVNCSCIKDFNVN